MARYPSRHTPLRNIRVDDALWQAARAKAASNGESVSDVIRDALQAYVLDGSHAGQDRPAKPSSR